MRTCRVCHQEKPDEEMQPRQNRCRVCTSEYMREYREKHRKHILEGKRKHYLDNKETCLAKSREYAERNQGRISEQKKRYREQHKEKQREYMKAYSATPEYKQKQKERQQRRYAVEADKFRARALKWAKDNPDRMVANKHKRKARIKGAGGSYTTAEWDALKEKYGNRCLRCGVHESECKRLSVDHVVPISLGGSNTIDNIQPLCRSCNSHKHIEVVDYRVMEAVQ